MVGLEELKKIIRKWHTEESSELWLTEALPEQSLERLAKRLELRFTASRELFAPVSKSIETGDASVEQGHVREKSVRRQKKAVAGNVWTEEDG